MQPDRTNLLLETISEKSIIESIPEKLNKTQIEMLKAVKTNKSISQEELAGLIGCSLVTIKKNTKLLRDKGILDKLGANRKGEWIILKYFD